MDVLLCRTYADSVHRGSLAEKQRCMLVVGSGGPIGRCRIYPCMRLDGSTRIAQLLPIATTLWVLAHANHTAGRDHFAVFLFVFVEGSNKQHVQTIWIRRAERQGPRWSCVECWLYSEPRNRGSAAPRSCIKPCADALQNVVSWSARCARWAERCYSRRRRVQFMYGDPLIFFVRCSTNLRSHNAPSVWGLELRVLFVGATHAPAL